MGGPELCGCRKDGSEFPVDIMLNALSAADGLVLAVVRDTTASKALSEKLRQLAYSDPLTGLPNRSALYRELEKSLKGDPATPIAPTSIALFDLDGFKEVNDTMGHSCGDKLLKEVARRWTAVIGRRQGRRALVSNCGDPAGSRKSPGRCCGR
jgi:predicted signal transduction protein with EAL and GGDEF domain